MNAEPDENHTNVLRHFGPTAIAEGGKIGGPSKESYYNLVL